MANGTSNSVIDGNLLVRGNIQCGNLALPNQCVGNDNIDPNNPIQSSNLEHQYSHVFSQPSTTVATATQQTVHVAYSNGYVDAIQAGLVTPCTGNATVTVDLLVNGVSILTSTCQLNSSQAGYGQSSGTPAIPSTYNPADVIEVKVTVNAGSGALGQGLFVLIVVREAAGV